jgi:YD repeat-containing protein
MAGKWRATWTIVLVLTVAWVPVLPSTAHATHSHPSSYLTADPPRFGDHIQGEEASPADGVNLIEPPEGVQSGDAQLDLRIEVPPGRRGMEPDLSLNYDSGGGNSWLGLGWSLPLPEVAIDDRWGVPRYDAGAETETYMFAGTQLGPVAHRGESLAREENRTFITRVDDGWESITRHGNSTQEYWWEGVDPDGNRWFFGGDPESGQVSAAVLADNSGNVFRWALLEVRDPFANAVRYSYDQVVANAIDGAGLEGRNIYPSEIRYTDSVDDGGAREDGPYRVVFTRDHNVRPDATSSSRGGFPMVIADRLQRIEVLFGDDLVRAYDLSYETGAFDISLLSAITERDADDNERHEHNFDYFDQISATDGYNAFGDVVDWDTGNPGIAGTIFEPIAEPFFAQAGPTTMSSSLGIDGNVHMYTGFNPKKPKKENSIGVKIGADFDVGQAVSRLIDINGNGLPDLVYQVDRTGPVYYRPNLSGPGGEPRFGSEQELTGLHGIDLELSFGFGVGPEVHTTIFSLIANVGAELSVGPMYFADVNASGLPDLVDGGTVYFNRLDDNGHPSFATDSSGSPVPIGGDGQTMEDALTGEEIEELEQIIEQHFTNVDTLRRWEAPFDGTIEISGNAALVIDAETEIDAGPARVAIQHNGVELWNHQLSEADPSIAAGVASLDVNSGDRIYFRIGGIGGPPTLVDWDPEITYVSDEVSGFDAQGRDQARYRMSEDFTLAANPEQLINVPFDGTLRLQGSVTKSGATSDRVRVRVEKNGEPVIVDSVFEANETGTIDLGQEFGVQEDDELRVRIGDDSRIDFGALDWNVDLFYTEAFDRDGNPVPVTAGPGHPDIPEGEPMFSLNVPVAGDTYAVERRSTIAGIWEAPEDGTLTVSGHGSFQLSALFDDIDDFQDFFERIAELDQPIHVTAKRLADEPGQPATLLQTGQIFLHPFLTSQSVGLADIEVEEGDRLEFAFSTPNWIVASLVSDAEVSGDLVTQRQDDFGETVVVPIGSFDAAIHDPVQPSPFSGHHRGWSVAGYDSTRERGTQAINEDELVLPDFIELGLDEGDLDDLDIEDWDTEDLEEFQIGEDGREDLEFDESPFEFSDEFNSVINALENQTAYLYYPDMEQRRWQGPDPQVWASSHASGAARLGSASDLVSNPELLEEFLTQSVRAPIKFAFDIRMSIGGDVLGGILPAGITPGGGFGVNWSNSVMDYIDLNGDGFPDIVSPGGVQYTNPDGSLGERLTHSQLAVYRAGFNTAFNIGMSANPVKATSDSGAKTDGQGRRSAASADGGGQQSGSSQVTAGGAARQAATSAADSTADGKSQGESSDSTSLEFGFSGELGAGMSMVSHDLIDMNGDGLPDAVFELGGQLMVAMNLGYGFASPEAWGSLDPLNLGRGTSANADIGLTASFNTGNYGFAGGMSASVSETETACEVMGFDETLSLTCGKETIELVDVNGSGRPDMLRETGNRDLYVSINTGRGFADEVKWGSLPDDFHAVDGSVNVGVGGYFTIGIGPLCKFGCYLIINPGAGASESMSRQGDTLVDAYGDGFPDAVVSDHRHELRVARNLTGNTNLLSRVERPLGATIDLEYQRLGNTIDHGSSQWVLSTVTVSPGEPAGAGEVQRSRYHYWGGLEDVREREFYGYHTVEAEHLDENHDVVRRVTRNYLNDTYYTNGLLIREETADADGSVFQVTDQSWRFVDPSAGFAPFDQLPGVTGVVVRQLDTRNERLVEGGEIANALVRTFDYKYDGLGDLVRVLDVAEGGEILELLYSYSDDVAPSNVPSSVQALGVEGRVLSHVEQTVEPTGAITQIREIDGDRTATTDIAVDDDGNVVGITGPPNAIDQRATKSIDYDGVVRTHPVLITDAFGLTETREYDLRFGLVTSFVDANSQTTSWSYDATGLVTQMTGPRQQGSGTSTVQVSRDTEASVPWAMTSRVDEARGGTLDRVVFADGLGRVRQVQKDATVHNPVGNTADDVTVVSNGRTFDALGREIAARQPGTDEPGVETTMSAADTDQPARQWAYDILDRVVTETSPGGAITETSYSLGSGRNDERRALETVIDPAGGIEATYRDARAMVTEIRRVLDGGNVWTSYQHDPIGRLIRVTDDHGHESLALYNALGHRTATETPSGGRIGFQYDLAGNLTRETTPTLRDLDHAIIYHYEFDRLVGADYPDVGEVRYEWGVPGASSNTAGRIQQIASPGGVEQRHYGSLGEIVSHIRTPSTARGAEPPTLETTLERDAWGRVLSMTYADGEQLTYSYDAGGRISAIDGEKAGNEETYVGRLEYDRFGEPAFLRFGNGVATSFTRNEVSRSLARLSTRDAVGRLFQNQEMGYDPVGNIIEAFDNVDEPHPSEYGGPLRWNYEYDDLYRLIGASAHWQSSSPHEERVSVVRTFDTIDNMLSETQHHEVRGGSPGGSGGGPPGGTPGGGGASNPGQNRDDQDSAPGSSGPPWRTVDHTTHTHELAYDGNQPHAPIAYGNRTFSYDADGQSLGWEHDLRGTRREITWGSHGRPLQIADQGRTVDLVWDHAAELAVRRGPGGETAFINPFMEVDNGQIATKHIFAGPLRVATVLMRPALAAHEEEFDEDLLEDWPAEGKRFFLHRDHAGDITYVTDADGEIFQHLRYFPSGAEWVSEMGAWQWTRLRLADRDRDAATWLEHGRVRDFDAAEGRWLSASRLDDILGDAAADVYEPARLHPFVRDRANPPSLADVDGSRSIVSNDELRRPIGLRVPYPKRSPGVDPAGGGRPPFPSAIPGGIDIP